MRILSSGDWHFDHGVDEELAHSITQIGNYANNNPVDLIIITGDVFHQRSSPRSRNNAIGCVKYLAEKSDVCMISGNHDAPGDLFVFSQLDTYNYVKVFDYPATITFGKVTFHLMPWFTKSGWIAKNPSSSKEESDKSVSEMAMNYLRNEILLNSGFGDQKHIFVGHVLINGARMQNHQPLFGEGVCLGEYDLQEAGFYAGIMGHVHLKQQFSNPLFFYNGSIAPLDYGETPDKYFSVLDTESNSVEFIKLKTVDRYSIDTEWAGFLDPACLDSDRVNGAKVRVNLKIKEGYDISLARHTMIDALMKLGAKDIKVNPQVIPVEKIKSEEISRLSQPKDKLIEYWKSTTTPEENRQKDMIDKLEILENETAQA